MYSPKPTFLTFKRMDEFSFTNLCSERADSSSEVDKLRMKEGSDINKSLATLGSVIQALGRMIKNY